MPRNILITGGAGFIGSHLAERLCALGHRVRILDNLSPQVHGSDRQWPRYLLRDIETLRGDVREPAACRRALEDIDVVYHLAASVGVGQSMYRIADYTDVNNLGTATLLEAIVARGVDRLIVASSMSVYGEGLYRTPDGRIVEQAERFPEALANGRWDLSDEGGEPWTPIPTPESKRVALASVYALSKFDQERLCLVVGRSYGFPVVALRLFNVYGPRQALSNPYTGVLAIFAARLLNDRPPLINEDGQQRRDFVSVYDVVRAFCQTLEVDAPRGQVLNQVFNVGSGTSISILDLADRLATALGKSHIAPTVTGSYRAGDIRHCFADIGQAAEVLGFRPGVSLNQGLGEFAAWLEGHKPVDRVEAARRELSLRGLAL